MPPYPTAGAANAAAASYNVVERYRTVFSNEAHTLECTLSLEERLTYHQAHGRTPFREMCTYAHQLLEDHVIEPNSKFPGACDYLINYERALSAFLRHAGSPLHNNLMEKQFRLAVRLRDAAPFFKNEADAGMATRI